MAARVYSIDPSLRMNRTEIHCETCGRGYTADELHDADGPRSIWRTACDCTRAGRIDLRADGRRPERPDDGDGARNADGHDGERDPDLDPPG